MSPLALTVQSPFAGKTNYSLYLAVGFIAGAVIALQIGLMRIFAVGSWAHFGSLVVSLAMLGFGLASVIMCLARDWFEQRWRGVIAATLFLFGPLMVAATLIAQLVPFNPIFIVSDPQQKWRLLANFILYLMPFLAGAFFLGTVFLKARETFGRVYFADLTGSGLAGLIILGMLYVFAPESIVAVPLLLWAAGGALWFSGLGSRRGLVGIAALAVLALAAYAALPGLLGIPVIAVSQYKGVAYARNFPDAQRIYRSISPFGDLQVYQSSYMHFAPGLSDNAAFNLPELPPNTYVGMYIDGDGPEGIMRNLSGSEGAYYHYLPMHYPYVIKEHPDTFVVQFGGGISTLTALAAGAKQVTVAESNPAVLTAFHSKAVADFTSDILANDKLKVIPYDGRLYVAHTDHRYDVIDLSLADSVGLSNPGGFAIVEKYPYTREAMESYMRALAEGGILSVTLWNKEEPPKSVIKLYATMYEAARDFDPASAPNSFFVAASYLSTTTVLYKRGGFTPGEVAKLRQYTAAMSFDEIYSPGYSFDESTAKTVLDDYWQSIFGNGGATDAATGEPAAGAPSGAGAAPDAGGAAGASSGDPTVAPDASPDGADNNAPTVLPATKALRMSWQSLINGSFDAFAAHYVFDTRALTNDRPYFAAYVKTPDLLRTTDRLELFQDEWGYLLLWATLAAACLLAMLLIALPVLFGWRIVFSRAPGKLGTILYFACLGLGYIMVEVGLIGRFTLALTNPTVSASALITGMLFFSGLGSLISERFVDRARTVMPAVFAGIAVLLFAYGRLLDPVLDAIGAYAYGWRLLFCFILIAPPSFLMGFPMATGMTWLARLGKDRLFVWAWGINGCFSVIGAALVPLIATAFGLSAVLETSGVAYLFAIPGLFAVCLPFRGIKELAPA
jgi:spermidine synthase